MKRNKSPFKSSIILAAAFSGVVSILGGVIAILQPFSNVEFLKIIYAFLTPEIQESILKIMTGISVASSGLIIHSRATKQNEPITRKQARKEI